MTTNNVMHFHEGEVKKIPTELPQLKPNEVLLKITHSGLCHSDVFYIPSGMALGHEGVGIVQEIGTDVTNFKIGDRAGGGYLQNVSHIVDPILSQMINNTAELWEVQILPVRSRDLVLLP